MALMKDHMFTTSTRHAVRRTSVIRPFAMCVSGHMRSHQPFLEQKSLLHLTFFRQLQVPDDMHWREHVDDTITHNNELFASPQRNASAQQRRCRVRFLLSSTVDVRTFRPILDGLLVVCVPFGQFVAPSGSNAG